jgi:hypothetical protein
MFLEVNDAHPMFDNSLASVFSGGHSAASNDLRLILPYLITLYEGSRLINTECSVSGVNGNAVLTCLLNNTIHLSPIVTFIALHLPKEYGGFPVIPFTEMIYRGHPDPVTSGLEWMKSVASYNPEINNVLKRIQSGRGFNTKVDKLRMYQDPTCLNFKTV